MDLEKNIFKNSIVDFDRLIKYGFSIKNKLYLYSLNFMNDSFRADIMIDNEGNVTGRVWDLQVDDEYTNLRIDNNINKFADSVKDAYKAILKDIRENCFIKRNFKYEQSNRVNDYILNKYNVKPVFLWKKFPGYGVFKNPNNNKWFSIIMNIDESKLNNNSGDVEIINLKIDDSLREKLLKQKGYYEAYHMNKKSWITIILNDTLGDDELFKLIDVSYDIIS